MEPVDDREASKEVARVQGAGDPAGEAGGAGEAQPRQGTRVTIRGPHRRSSYRWNIALGPLRITANEREYVYQTPARLLGYGAVLKPEGNFASAQAVELLRALQHVRELGSFSVVNKRSGARLLEVSLQEVPVRRSGGGEAVYDLTLIGRPIEFDECRLVVRGYDAPHKKWAELPAELDLSIVVEGYAV